MRRVIIVLLLLSVVLSPAYSVLSDWSEEKFRVDACVTSISFGMLDFYEGHSSNPAEIRHFIPISFGLGLDCRYNVTPYLGIGADAFLVFEVHDASELQTLPYLLVNRLYPALAVEFISKSIYFTEEYRMMIPQTPSLRFEGTVLLGLSPGFSSAGVSAMPFIGLKPAVDVSVDNVDVFLSAQFNVLWGGLYRSPYKVVMFDLTVALGMGWRF